MSLLDLRAVPNGAGRRLRREASARRDRLLASCRYHLCRDVRLPDGGAWTSCGHQLGELYFGRPVAIDHCFPVGTGNAVAALKAGAFDYLAKPVALDQYERPIKSALRAAEF